MSGLGLEAVLAAVLAAHEYMLGLSKGSICACGFVPDVNPKSLHSQQDYHRAHVAAAVLDWLKGELAGEEMREAVAQTVPLGFGPRDPYADVYEAATAALGAVAERLGGGA